jgi:hypothetical protein
MFALFEHCGERKRGTIGGRPFLRNDPLPSKKEVDRANYNHVAIDCPKQSTRKPHISHFHTGRVSWLCKKAATA